MKTLRSSSTNQLELVFNQYLLRWVGAVICLIGSMIFYWAVTEHKAIWIIVFDLTYPIIGIILLFSTQSIRVLCNKTTNRLTITKKSLLNQTEESIPLNKITDVVIQQTTGQRSGMIYRVAMILDDAREIPLTQSYDGYLTSKIKTAQTLADFLSIKIDLTALVNKDSQKKALGKTMFFIGLIPMLIFFPFILRKIIGLFS